MDHRVVYRIEPELACEFAADQVWVDGNELAGRSPRRPVHLEFDSGARGAFAACAPVWVATKELVNAWQAAGVSGFRTRPLIATAGPTGVSAEQDRLPAYVEVEICGTPQDDVHHIPGEAEVRVSRRAAEIYARFEPGEGDLYGGTEGDMYGDDLPEEVRTVVPRFEI